MSKKNYALYFLIIVSLYYGQVFEIHNVINARIMGSIAQNKYKIKQLTYPVK